MTSVVRTFTRPNGKAYGPYTIEVDLEEKRAKGRAWYRANREHAKAAARAWVKAHPERAEATKQAYYLAHQEEIRERSRLWSKENREQSNASARAWRRANPDKTAASARRGRQNQPVLYLLRIARARAKLKGLAFDIAAADLAIPEVCPLLGIRIDPFTEVEDFHPSLDRLDNTKGYVKGNVFVVSYRANLLKNNATADELRKIADGIDRLMEANK